MLEILAVVLLAIITALALAHFGIVHLGHKPTAVAPAAPPAPGPITVNAAPINVTVHPPAVAPDPVKPAVVETAPRIPTPRLPADWPAGSGFVAGTLVPNILLPGSKVGEGAWSYAYAQSRYPTLAAYEVDAMITDPEFTARGFVWRDDGVPCAGPYKV